jgi:GTP-binding protein
MEALNPYNSGAMINYHLASYIISCPDYSFRPKDQLPEVVFLGRSNVGKSTLINTLCSQKIAFASKNAGKTRYLNYFLIDKKFYLVDSPGYGYTAYGNFQDENFGAMMENYFTNPLLRGAVLLLDSRRDLNDDDTMLLRFLKKDRIPFVVVFTKCDQAKQSELALARKRAGELGVEEVYFSAQGKGLDPLRGAVARFVE